MIATLLLSLGSIRSTAATPENGGPFNVQILAGGIGVSRELAATDRITAANAPWSLSAWVRPDILAGDPILLALGNAGTAASRTLMLTAGRPGVSDGSVKLIAPRQLAPGRWTHLAAVSDGTALRLYVDGRQVGTSKARAIAIFPQLSVAPVVSGRAHFGGTLVDARVDDEAWSAQQVRRAVAARPVFDLVQLWHVGVGWAFQKSASIGLTRQQDAWTLPQSKGGYTAPVAKPAAKVSALVAGAPGHWQINDWRLAAAPDITDDGPALSRPDADLRRFVAATVPGTVLQTLVDRGVYPDPYYGLNNLRIPETLARQAYWYRASFTVPRDAAERRLAIEFGGINYASEVWVNGTRLGSTRGAFIRGRFAFVPRPGANVIAVRVSPPPHPGIPHEQSIRGGVGDNGGALAIDGPTFVATEGWDWIPGIRDRNTGLWRPVELVATDTVRIGDPQVVTDLPLPRIDRADVYVTVPVINEGAAAPVTVTARFDDVTVTKTVQAPPGRTDVRFAPNEFAQLRVANPKLWWPNGYGDPALHTMTIDATVNGGTSDTRTLRFGIREVSYDLSLFDAAGSLRRVNIQTTDGKLAGQKLIDVRHAAIKESPEGWAESLTLAGEHSPAVTTVPQTMALPHLAIRVNGVPIAARGGNWGMDDAMKRVSRASLAPYFRLQRDAHMNIIRNWMGNNDEDEFYDLADENGMMVLNDFWQSTQNYQIEPEDPQLFLANARDVVARYRNHPSIVAWFGRNEGVPYPTLNEGLDDAIFELDGTRWYTGSSNTVNLQGSGPYNYRSPVGYFTDLASGFSVETGTPSLSTLESIESNIPAADRWPLSDTLAYHDWHFSGNGDTKSFMTTLDTMFGAGTSLADFERKAQMMNLETHKAMFEGFLAHLWTKNSGRLLWMTHPAWPSNMWQIYSSDNDTQASYYGAKTATEPLHIQLDLPDNRVTVLNTTRAARRGLTATTRVYALDGSLLFERADKVDAVANAATPLAPVPLFAKAATVLVDQRLTDGAGTLVSRNFYWRGQTTADYRALTTMATVALEVTSTSPVTDGDDRRVTVTLRNPGKTPALAAKLTLVDPAGKRILPAYYDDNYVSLLPGETLTLAIRYPASVTARPSVRLRGWNILPR